MPPALDESYAAFFNVVNLIINEDVWMFNPNHLPVVGLASRYINQWLTYPITVLVIDQGPVNQHLSMLIVPRRTTSLKQLIGQFIFFVLFNQVIK